MQSLERYTANMWRDPENDRVKKRLKKSKMYKFEFTQEMVVRALESNGYTKSDRGDYWRHSTEKYIDRYEQTTAAAFEQLLRKQNLL